MSCGFDISPNESFSISSGRPFFDVRAMEDYGVKFTTDLAGLRSLRDSIHKAIDKHYGQNQKAVAR